jgi:hypothetical protein
MDMPRPARKDGVNKFRRYRATKRERGMKLVRLWVPDPKAPGFRQKIRREARLLKGAPEELDALDFIEAVGDWNAEK